MKLTVGVTGGAGYIGSHVVHDLIEKGYKVIVIDDLSTGNESNIITNSPYYNFICGNSGNEEDLKAFFSFKPVAVMHFSAFKAAGESMKEPESYSRNNIRNTCVLIENMHLNKCAHFIFSSTAAVYGMPVYQPVDERHPIDPINYYGFTKHMIEKNIEWFSKLRGIKYASLRYFNAAGYDLRGRVTGLEMKPNNLLPVVMETAAGIRESFDIFGDDYPTQDGTGIRDYIHVNDLSEAHIAALKYLLDKNENITVNLGTGSGYTVLEVLAAAEKISGKSIKHRIVDRRDGDPSELIASSSLAYEKLGWKANHSDIETILGSMWNLYSKLVVR